jgi:endoglucanase
MSSAHRTIASRLTAFGLAVALAGSGVWAAGAPAAAATATATTTTTTPAEEPLRICEKFASTPVSGNRYIVQNNVWGADTRQCLDVTRAGFRVVAADHHNATNGPPAAYPSIYAGCHYGNCTTGSGLPLQVRQFRDVRSGVAIRTPDDGQWNAAYDLWFDPTPDPTGQNLGAELMIWLDHRGAPQPVGAKVATVRLEHGTWDVWFGDVGWNVVTYVRTAPQHRAHLDLGAFTTDAVRRGHVEEAWYLTSVQFGFEPWELGTGLAVEHFAVRARG